MPSSMFFLPVADSDTNNKMTLKPLTIDNKGSISTFLPNDHVGVEQGVFTIPTQQMDVTNGYGSFFPWGTFIVFILHILPHYQNVRIRSWT